MSEKELIQEATSPEKLEEVQNIIKNDVEKNIASRPMNRKQRRALQKKMGKKGRKNKDIIFDTAKKIDYINLIEKLKILNAKKEEEEKNYENPN